jgi:hypothetical protein
MWRGPLPYHLTVIDKDHKKLGGGGNQPVKPLSSSSLHFFTSLARNGRLIGIMSALQTFMLVVDHDNEEAKRIAEGVAQGQSDLRPTLPRTHHVV